jgi:hypothetical protein
MRLSGRSVSVHNGSPLCITDRVSLLNVQLELSNGVYSVRQQFTNRCLTTLLARMEGKMTRRNAFRLAGAVAWSALAAAVLSPPVAAQSASDIVGTWTLVSSVTERDGVKTDQFGNGAKGMLVLDGSGHFMLTIIGPDLPKFASNNRAGGTPEENKAVVSKSIAMFGEYSVSTSDKTLTFKVDSATFPNWNGTEQKRLLAPIEADVLKYVTPTASSGGVGTVTWKRIK